MHPELLVRKRIWLMTLVLTGLFLLAAARIAVLTTSEAASLTERGIRQWTKAGIVTARRGTITDRKGRTLAISATAYIVTADPRLVSDTEKFLRLEVSGLTTISMASGCENNISSLAKAKRGPRIDEGLKDISKPLESFIGLIPTLLEIEVRVTFHVSILISPSGSSGVSLAGVHSTVIVTETLPAAFVPVATVVPLRKPVIMPL